VPMTASRGVPYIATRAEAAIGSAMALEMLAERRGTVDAAIVAAFGDPGLGGARELFDFPVVGMAEAAMLVACTLGRRFGIVSFSRSLEPWFAEIVEWHGMSGRCAAIPWPARRWPAWPTASASACRCRWSTASRPR